MNLENERVYVEHHLNKGIWLRSHVMFLKSGMRFMVRKFEDGEKIESYYLATSNPFYHEKNKEWTVSFVKG
jgi:ribosomal protein L31E